MNRDDSVPAIPARETRGHKGTFGTVAVVGGCAAVPASDAGDARAAAIPGAGAFMLGGPCFAAMAALRCGCGLAQLAVPAPLLSAALTLAPSATAVGLAVNERGEVVAHRAAEVLDALLSRASCAVVGPGLGTGEGPAALSLRAASQDQTPVVLDADALNNLATMPELVKDVHAPAILTPHIGEFRRLAAAVAGPVRMDTPDDAAQSAEELARRLGAVVVLKSDRTVVTDGFRTWVHDAPNPVLATAGSGDVLAGAIGSMVAQFFARPIMAGSRTVTSERMGGLSLYDCARLGVMAHARAAAAWAGTRGVSAGMLAGDLIQELPGAVQGLRSAGA